MKYFYLIPAFIVITGFYLARKPMEAIYTDSAAYRWLHKSVLDKRTLDDMEHLDNWRSFTTSGVEVVDARKVIKSTDSSGSVANIELSKQQVHEGNTALLMTTPTRLQGAAPKNGRGWGRSGVRRIFNGEDWTSYNRISIWIYPDLPGFYTTALDCQLYNDGKVKLPAIFGQEGQTSLILKNHEWNHVVWEIGNVERDKITGFEMSYGLSGSYPGEAKQIRFYFDQMDLEKVDPDKTDGWDVWKGRISYSHTGYQTGAQKSAIASGVNSKTFSLIDQANGTAVLTKAVVKQTSHIGSFDVMDFSEVRKPGNYVLKAGSLTTKPFRIEANPYERTVLKALNFFYAERCGTEIPGIHGSEHQDWICMHGSKSMVINGGWHDAGDLTQGLENTGEIDFSLFSLAEKLHARNENPALYRRVLEEAEWGLDWIIKTSFGDGYRNTGSINSRRTDNILGTDDDVVSTAQNNPMSNFQAAAAEALAANVLKSENPALAARALRAAESDWKFAVEGMPSLKPSKEIWRGSFDSDNVQDELPSQAIIASLQLWRATKNQKYADKAIALAPVIINSQQRSNTDWDTPMNGFFYTSTEKERILHYCHRGREQGPTLALTALCEAFPNHKEWIKWYAAATLYSEYLKKLASYTAPYNVMPASVYVDTEYMHVPESRKESFRKQVLNGIALGKGHYLRLFPVWMDYRGHFGTILPQAQALASAAHLRGDLPAAQLAEHQLEWIVGRNPFSESAMYGEGNDFVPLYTPSSGDIVGALPVGIQSRGEEDAPYWPVQNMWTYKEIWVHPVTNWVWLLKDLEGPAVINGQADGPITFTDIVTKQHVTISPDKSTGHFSTSLPEGRYAVNSSGMQQNKTFLPGGLYNLDYRKINALTFELTQKTAAKGQVIIRLIVNGSGKHQFNIRADNLTVKGETKTIDLSSGKPATLVWQANVAEDNTPWVAVIIPDNKVQYRKEVRGI